MYEESPFCTPPPDDAVLWRYMDFTKFVSVLDKRALFFSATDKFGDPFEGSISKVTAALRPKLHPNIPPNTLQTFTQSLKEARRFTLISCWHENSYESEAMWKLYARETDGIVIKTDFDALKKSFTCSEGVNIGRVSYVDYESAIIPEDNVLSPFLHKRKSFEHEREVRAIHILHRDDEISKLRNEEIDGAYYEVDLSLLIKAVIVAPFAPDWFIELVKSVAALYDLKVPVVESTLADSPTWG